MRAGDSMSFLVVVSHAGSQCRCDTLLTQCVRAVDRRAQHVQFSPVDVSYFFRSLCFVL